MKFYFTRKNLVVLVLFLCLLILWMFLSGCSRGAVQPDAPCVSRGPANALAGLAVWATWIAGAGLLVCGLVAFFRPSWAIAKAALACLAVMLSAGILHWISAHWAILLGLCTGVILLSGVAWAYINRHFLEKKTGVDLNRNGTIGT